MRGRETTWGGLLALAINTALACSEPFTAGPGAGGSSGASSAGTGGNGSSRGGASSSQSGAGAAAGNSGTENAGAESAGAENGGAGGVVQPGTGGTASTQVTYAGAILAAKPLAYWRMGIESGLVVPDETGHANSLLLQGTGHQLSVGGALRAGDDGAIRFDGAASFAMAESPRVFDFNDGAAFTLECWARRETGGESYFQHLVSNTVGNPDSRTGFMLYLLPEPADPNSARSAFEYDAPGMETGLWGLLPEASAWAYYVAVYDGSMVTLYVDATLADTRAADAKLSARSGPFTVARASNGGSFFKGALDEIAIYARALSATEIVQHFALASQR